MIKQSLKFLSSMRLMTILLLIFAGTIGYATFIENDFGRSSAKALIFNAWWFELILILLVYNLLNNLVRYKLFRPEKRAVLIFHLSWIFIFIGAGITRYISYEGMMHIREGESSNIFISDDTFLQVHINDKIHQYNYDKKLFLSGITNNRFRVNVDFKQYDINIKGVDFLPNVKDSVFINTKEGRKMLHLVVPGDNGMQDEYLVDSERKIIKGEMFTYNNFTNGAINFKDSAGFIVCNSPYLISSMSMLTSEKLDYLAFNNFLLMRKRLYDANGLNFVLKNTFTGKQKPISTSNIMKDGSRDALVVNVAAEGKNHQCILYGGKGYTGEEKVFSINNLNFKLSYGSKHYTTPFSIKLNDFQLERYPGSMSPSSYASEVLVLDDNKKFPYRIYMNNVLNYKGYRFFQSSYDKDEKGTILSVNHDWWGTLVTYIGYFLLALGFIFVFFSKETRYNYLSKQLKKIKNKSLLVVIAFFSSFSLFAFDDVIPLEHVDRFDALVVQDNGGRLKPAQTLTSEYLRKIYGTDTYNNLTATQVVLGMMNDPVEWSKKQIIKVKHPKLLKLLNVTDNKSRSIKVSFNNFFLDGNYLLTEDVERAYHKLPKDRTKYDKEIISVDERVNICFTIFSSGIFRFFPLPNDSNNTWFSYKNNTHFSNDDSLFVVNIIPMYFSSIKNGFQTNDWSLSDSIVNYIDKFQRKYGSDVIPSDTVIGLEILYNKLSIFSRLFPYYFVTGLFLIIFVIIQLFYNNKLIIYSIQFFKWLILIGFTVHICGLIIRWIISNHAPWSNGYESMIYIAFATILAGIIFSKRSTLTLAATAVVASLLLMVAHLNWLDPEITNLVPVLNSYWLLIHVAIITASYGFFALGSILGLISLCIISVINKKNKSKLNNTLLEITLINEKTLEVGLFMLAVGTFLGGVWANESWGRYWGWDPKETWAFVSILIYTFVLHMRFIPSLKNKLVFNSMSMFAIWTIIMTYFGVNYYLSGLHSYAAGDPMPIPVFVYYLLAIMIIITIIARINYKKYYS